jgi:hypothetical protein
MLNSQKLDPGCSSRILDLDFSHPGSRGQKSTGSGGELRQAAIEGLGVKFNYIMD